MKKEKTFLEPSNPEPQEGATYALEKRSGRTLIILLSSLSAASIAGIGWLYLLVEHKNQQGHELDKTVQVLLQENAELKETAEYRYKQGISEEALGNLADAKHSFSRVVSMFPTSNLASIAERHLAAVNSLLAKKQEEQKQATRDQGESIDFDTFYAKAKSTGLPTWKRFRFAATIDNDFTDLYLGTPSATKGLGADAAFDDDANHEAFLKNYHNDRSLHEVVASLADNGRIQVHRID